MFISIGMCKLSLFLNVHLKNEADKLLKDVFMYRAYIAQNKPSLVLSEIDQQTAPAPLKALRYFADYMANPAKRFLSSNLNPSNSTHIMRPGNIEY
ncbi:unnamed protein product [Gongylonema pulchrum]|uniref:Coatomer subunit epsilon n=1 Tax=Gongylonema pulchrum TaxID=637853 RepID=A0A183ENM7_9BILA|nr:unnamed protein product [Gongylonema pulchrum]